MMKKLLPLFALFASFLYAADYLVAGVDKDDASTYYDFNKVFDGTDDDLCWAYSAANVLQWWQDKQSDFYISMNAIPDGKTYSDAYASDIVSTFVASWVNDGGYEINGFEWWLSDTGCKPLTQDEEMSFPSGGGYWSDLVSTTTYIGEEIAIANDNAYEQYFIEVMDNAILAGSGMTLGIYTEDGGGHAITLWGYGVDDEDGSYCLYLTDSDDEISGMFSVDIEYHSEAEVWYLQDYYEMDNWFVGDVTTLAVGVLSVPEPATPLLSLMALGGLLARRRRV